MVFQTFNNTYHIMYTPWLTNHLQGSKACQNFRKKQQNLLVDGENICIATSPLGW